MRLIFDILFYLEDTINVQILGVPHRWLNRVVPAWPQYLIILTVLFFTGVLAYLAPVDLLPLLVMVPPAIGSLIVLLRWPPLGLFIALLSSLLLPSPSLPGGVNLPTLFLILIIALWLFDKIVHPDRFPFIQSRPIWPLFALIATVILSFAIGQFPWYPFANQAPLDAQIGGLAIFVLAGAAFILVGQQLRELRWLQIMTFSYIGLAGLYVAGWFVPGFGDLTGIVFQYGATSNSVFWVFLVALAFSQAVFNTHLSKFWRSVLLAIVAYTFYVAFVLNSGWKSGYLPAVVVIGTILAARSWRAGLAVALIGAVPAYLLSTQAISSDEYSTATRLEAWMIVLDMVKINPITGFGPANYYWYTPLFKIRGYAVSFNSHNQYMDILAQAGILGLLCVGWFSWEMGKLSWWLKDRAPAGFARAYVYGIIGGLAGMLASGVLADWFFPFTYNIGFNGFRGAMLGWIFLGGIVTIEQMVRNRPANQELAAGEKDP